MNSLRWIVAVATVSLSLPVLATPTPVTAAYDFNSSPTGGTIAGTTYSGSQAAYGNNHGTVTNLGDTASYSGLYNSTYFGNSATYAGVLSTTGTLATTVTAWASTGTGNSLTGGTGVGSGVNTTTTNNGTIQNAVLTAYQTANGGTGTYSNNGYALAETSRNTNSGNLNHEFTCTTTYCNDVAPNHAVDNDGAYETLMFSFTQAVTLTSVTLGYPSVGSGNAGSSDLTLLYCTAKGVADNGCIPSSSNGFGGKTYYQLVSSGDWAYSNLLNLSSTNDTGATGLTASSQYWMIGAFIADLPNQIVGDNTPDYVKIRSLTVCTQYCAVPEPSSIALFGIAGGALWLGRRRRSLRIA